MLGRVVLVYLDGNPKGRFVFEGVADSITPDGWVCVIRPDGEVQQAPMSAVLIAETRQPFVQ